MAVAGSLEIQMLAKMARLQRDMNEGKRIVKRSTDDMGAAVNKLKGLLGALGLGFGAVQIGRFISNTIDAQDKLAKLSRQLNISVENLAGWGHAAQLSGFDTETMNKSLGKLSKIAYDASLGLQTAEEFFEILGITVKNSNGSMKDAADLTLEVAESFKVMEDGTEKTAIAMGLFGRSGMQLIPMLNQGAEGIRAMVEEGQRLNPVTAESARLAEEWNDNMLRVGSAVEAVFVKQVNDLLPLMAELSDMMWEASKSTDDMEKDLNPMVEIIKTLIIFASEFAYVWRTLGLEIALAADTLASFFDRGVDGWKESRAAAKQVIDEQFADHNRFLSRIAAVGQWPEGYGPRAPAQVETPEVGVTAKRPGDKKEVDEIAKEIARQQSAAEGALRAMEKQQAVFSDTTELAKVLFEIERGGYAMATEEIHKKLIASAMELDALKAKEEWEKERQANAEEMAKLEAELYEQRKERQEEELLKWQEQRNMRAEAIEQLIDENATELELLTEKYEAEKELLAQYLKDKGGVWEDYHTQMLRTIQKFEKNKARIEEKSMTEAEKFNQLSMRRKAETIFGEMESITSGVAQHNRAMFELNKASGIANAIIDAYVGISKTLATYPFPINVAMAALHAATAFAQVQAISSSSFTGGGGAAPSLAGGTAAPPVTPVQAGGGQQAEGQTTVINFKGTTNERKMLKQFAAALNEQTHNGGKVLVN